MASVHSKILMISPIPFNIFFLLAPSIIILFSLNFLQFITTTWKYLKHAEWKPSNQQTKKTCSRPTASNLFCVTYHHQSHYHHPCSPSSLNSCVCQAVDENGILITVRSCNHARSSYFSYPRLLSLLRPSFSKMAACVEYAAGGNRTEPINEHTHIRRV